MGLFVDADMHRLRWGRILALVSALAVITAVVLLYCHDEPPSNDADMRVSIPPIPDGENGIAQIEKLDRKPLEFYAFAETHGVNDDDRDKITEGLARNDTVVDAFLSAVAPEMQQVDAILALPYFEVSGNVSSLTKSPIAGTLDASRVLQLRAQRRAQAGDYAGATDDVLRLRRLAQRYSEGHLLMINLLLDFLINNIANAACANLLNNRALPDGEAARLAEAWNREIPWAETFRQSMMREYQYMCDNLETIKAEDYSDIFFMDFGRGSRSKDIETELIGDWLYYTRQPNATHRLLGEIFRSEEHMLDGTYAARPQPPPQPKLATTWEIALWVVKPNISGRGLAFVLGPAMGSVAQSGFETVARDRLVRAGLALRRYYDDDGALPPSLSALVPRYLAAVPTDPFDGQPLRYDLGKALVYSVGTDLIDHHGSKFVGKPTDAFDYQDPFGDDKQPTLELKFAQKAGP